MEILQIIIYIILILIGIYQIYINREKDVIKKDNKKKKIEEISKPIDFIPSDRVLVKYIIDTFIGELEEMRSPSKYIGDYVYLDNGIKLEYDSDADSIILKLKVDLLDNKKLINTKNLTYIQTNNKAKKKKFLNKFNVSEYPKPLIMFKNPKILFGYIESENIWKIFINSEDY
jgi:hypothetical protein